MTINMSLPENDVVVYGATSGAIAAAVQSAKLGRKVVLVSPDKHIGAVAYSFHCRATVIYISVKVASKSRASGLPTLITKPRFSTAQQ